METRAQVLRRSFLLLPFVAFYLLPNANTTGTADQIAARIEKDCLLDVDGTQLINETKALVADLLHVSTSQVNAAYVGQMTDGRFKYSASSGLQSGFVYWTVVNGQIIEDDAEGF